MGHRVEDVPVGFITRLLVVIRQVSGGFSKLLARRSDTVLRECR